MRNPRPARSAGPDRSAPAPLRSTCPTPSPSPIARLRLRRGAVSRRLFLDRSRTASAGPPRLVATRSLGPLRRGTGSDLRSGDRSPVHTSDPTTGPRDPPADPGLPEPAASGKLPSRSVSVSGDREISSGVQPSGTRASRKVFPRSSPSTGRSTAGDPVVPRPDRLSTGPSTDPSTRERDRVHDADRPGHDDRARRPGATAGSRNGCGRVSGRAASMSAIASG